jgi:hypothetical protein
MSSPDPRYRLEAEQEVYEFTEKSTLMEFVSWLISRPDNADVTIRVSNLRRLQRLQQRQATPGVTRPMPVVQR